MHPIQDLFLESFPIYYNLICTPICTKFYSCKKWVLHLDIHFDRAQFLRGGVVEAAWSRIRPHLSRLPPEQFNLRAEKRP
jgi:hypothetical protein